MKRKKERKSKKWERKSDEKIRIKKKEKREIKDNEGKKERVKKKKG